jgi:glucose-1-phosphate cytidylyltransferase
MKVVIHAGGLGTRIGEESRFKPKPMIELGGMVVRYSGARSAGEVV